MGSILAPVDFSEMTPAVIAVAESLAAAFSARLWLLHVSAPDPDFVGFEAGPQAVRDQRAHHLRGEHRELQEVADRLRTEGVEATALLIQGPTVEKILSEAERVAAEWIVIGSHGRGAVHRALLGSVSEGVLHRARCKIAIVPRRSLAVDVG
jgi:nucleotide-binding universal stress UspA family protein